LIEKRSKIDLVFWGMEEHRVACVCVLNQNGEIFYFSIEAMLDTVTDWVACAEYKMFEPLPSEIEKAIWNKHNPGVFLR